MKQQPEIISSRSSLICNEEYRFNTNEGRRSQLLEVIRWCREELKSMDAETKKESLFGIAEDVLMEDFPHIPMKSVKGKTRKSEVVFVRQLFVYMMRTHTTATLREIGMYLGGRDHSTCIAAVNSIENWMLTNKVRRDMIQKALNKYKNRL